MKYAVIYLNSEWDQSSSKDISNKRKASIRLPNNTIPLKKTDTMPPYGATIAGNVLRNIKQKKFIGVFDENMINGHIEDIIYDMYMENNRDDITLFFSVYVFNNDRTIRIIEKIKRFYANIIIVIGGPFAEYFIQNKNVDSVIIGDAETGIPKYFEKTSKVIFAPNAVLDMFPIDFNVIKKDFGFEEGITNSVRGCKYRTGRNKGCVFCSMKERTLRLRNPEFVLKEMAKEAEDLDIEWIFETADTFALSETWLKAYSTMRSKLSSNGFEILKKLKLHAYINPCDIRNKEIPKLLYDCGIRRVCLGIESGDDTILANMNKPQINVENNRRALRFFERSDIDIRLGIVLGIGESESTLMNTYNFLKGIKKTKDVSVVMVALNPVLVLPGSKLYEIMISNKSKIKKSDIKIIQEINDKLKTGNGLTKDEINLLSKIYIESVSSVSYERLLTWKKKMSNILISQNVKTWTFGEYN